MTKIEITEMKKQEQDALMFNRHPDFKMIDENTGMVGSYAIIKFNEKDPQDLDDEKESAAEICERYTHEEIMPALALMAYQQDDRFDKLPEYIAEFEKSRKSGEPMGFYPFATNEKELRGYLEDEMIDQNIDEHLKDFGGQYIYSPLGALFLNR